MPTTDMMIQALADHRAQCGDSAELPPEYFWQLVERFRADLINQAFSILGNQPDAEDVAQESLCEAFQDLGSLQDPGRLGHWLRQINRRNALDLLRSRKANLGKIERARQESNRWDPVSGGFSKVDLREVVAKAIDSLPGELREIVALRYWEHLSYQELADRLALPMGTVKSRLARADGMLEQRLEKYVRDETTDPSMPTGTLEPTEPPKPDPEDSR